MKRFNAGSRVAALSAALFAAVAAGCGTIESQESTQAVTQASSFVGISSFTLSSPTVAAGDSITATVTLSGSAQSASGGVIVYVGFESAILAGPRFIRVPNGQSSGTFTLYSNPFLAASTSTSISAITSSPQPFSFVSQTLSVASSPTRPGSAPPQVSSLTLSPATVTSGSASTGTVTLTDPAPASGAVVQLFNPKDSLNLDAEPPPVVIIPAGATSATFTIPTHLSSSIAAFAQDLIVGSYFGGVFQGAQLTIHPSN